MLFRRTAGAALLAAVLALPAAAPAGAASDFYLKIEGVKGESTSPRHQGDMELLSFSYAVAGDPTGKQPPQSLHVSKTMDSASPALTVAAASGRRFTCATLTEEVRGGDGEPRTASKVVFGDVVVSSYQAGASSDRPTESLSLTFSKIRTTYVPQDERGGSSAPITEGWDFLRRTPFEPGSGC